jgi:hypothetical protein
VFKPSQEHTIMTTKSLSTPVTVTFEDACEFEEALNALGCQLDAMRKQHKAMRRQYRALSAQVYRVAFGQDPIMID